MCKSYIFSMISCIILIWWTFLQKFVCTHLPWWFTTCCWAKWHGLGIIYWCQHLWSWIHFNESLHVAKRIFASFIGFQMDAEILLKVNTQVLLLDSPKLTNFPSFLYQICPWHDDVMIDVCIGLCKRSDLYSFLKKRQIKH